LPGEPVAPMIRRGAQMNAPSRTFLSTSDLVSTFSRFQMPRRVCISLWQGTAKSGPCSPEGCASILWKSAEHAPEAAETLGITAVRLKQQGLIDKVVNEPLGGAHRDHAAMMVGLRKALTEMLRQLQEQTLDDMLDAREDKILSYGKFKELATG